MILSRVRPIEKFDSAAIWSSLRQFKNQRYAARQIAELHSPPGKQQRNVDKQARQIGYCIAQAEEYFSAARHAGLATKPVLTYYGTLSLILAEALLKQTGTSSLDAARAQNAHHGLQLKLSSNPSRQIDLSESASLLRAKPFRDCKGDRVGTFHLWHKSAREIPIFGEISTIHVENRGTREIGCVATPTDEEFGELPASGLTLLDCFRNLPALHRLIAGHAIEPDLVRADAKLTIDHTKERTRFEMMVHPASAGAMKAIEEKIVIGDDAKEVVKRADFKSGFAMTIDTPFNYPPGAIKFPSSVQYRSEMFYFSPQNYLNELGYYYVALFILGTYCRYYPDMWMVDVSEHTALVTLASEFLESCLIRVPALALSELSREYLCLTQRIY